MTPRTSVPCAQLVTTKADRTRCVRCGWAVDQHQATAPAPATIRTAPIWADTIKRDVCSSAACRRPIFFAMHTRTGAWMPFDTAPVAIYVEQEIETRRERWIVNLAASHFASCPAAETFRRRRA